MSVLRSIVYIALQGWLYSICRYMHVRIYTGTGIPFVTIFRSPGTGTLPGRSDCHHNPVLSGTSPLSRSQNLTTDASSTSLSERLQAVEGEVTDIVAAQVSFLRCLTRCLPAEPSTVQVCLFVCGSIRILLSLFFWYRYGIALKGLSHEINFQNFDINLQNLV